MPKRSELTSSPARSQKRGKAPSSVRLQSEALGLNISPSRLSKIPKRLQRFYEAQTLLEGMKLDKERGPADFLLLIRQASEEA